MTILLAQSLIWGSRLMLLFFIAFKMGQKSLPVPEIGPHAANFKLNNHSNNESLMHQVLSKRGPNPLSGLHQWIVDTETILKTFPIKDKDIFLKRLEAMKVKFAKLIQISMTKMKESDNGPLFKGHDAEIFYKGIEILYKEKSGLEMGIDLNIQTYGYKV